MTTKTHALNNTRAASPAIEGLDVIKSALEYYAKNARSWISGNETEHAEKALAILNRLYAQDSPRGKGD